MKEYYRNVEDVIGTDPCLLKHWDGMPDPVKRILLTGETRVKTLGELQLLENQLRAKLDQAPTVF